MYMCMYVLSVMPIAKGSGCQNETKCLFGKCQIYWKGKVGTLAKVWEHCKRLKWLFLGGILVVWVNMQLLAL